MNMDVMDNGNDSDGKLGPLSNTLFLTTFREENTTSTCFKENNPTAESSEPLADENIVFMNESDNIMKLHASAL